MRNLLLVTLSLLSFEVFGQNNKAPIFISLAKGRAHAANEQLGRRWYRKVVFIGGAQDTVEVNKDGRQIIRGNEFLPAVGRGLYFRQWECDTCLSVEIDTSQIVPFVHRVRFKDRYKNRVYKSNPVLIRNNTDSILKFGYGVTTHVVVEALDTDLQWKPIEGTYIYKCGTGFGDLFLKPKEFATVLTPIYSGSFRTKLRLKLYGSYSLPYSGSINRSQFSIEESSY